MNKKIRIGCASGFWGDTDIAAPQIIEKGNVDYLVCDYLSEVTMSILSGAKLKSGEYGYAKDFINHVGPLLKTIKQNKIKVISNAGGVNLDACKKALSNKAKKENINLKIITVEGDDLSGIQKDLQKMSIKEIDSGKPLPENLLSINAYLGAPGIKRALDQGADIVITGRCVDSALALGPLMYEFNWKENEYDLLASGSLAGHIIECGAQSTGGNFTDWEIIDNFEDIGFPIVEVEENGEFIVTKPEGTGGIVNFGTIAEQLLYEIGDPGAYILPDVICDFTNVNIKNLILKNSRLGVAVKDGSNVYLENIVSQNNEYDLAVFNKKNEFDIPNLKIKNFLKKNKKILQSKNSKLVIDEKTIFGEQSNAYIKSILY